MATNKRPRKAYKRIGFEDRKKIEALNAQGKTVDEMAMAIGVHSATCTVNSPEVENRTRQRSHSIPSNGEEQVEWKNWISRLPYR